MCVLERMSACVGLPHQPATVLVLCGPQELVAAQAKSAEAASQLSATQAQHLSELAREAQSKRDLHERSASVEEVTALTSHCILRLAVICFWNLRFLCTRLMMRLAQGNERSCEIDQSTNVCVFLCVRVRV